MSLAIIPGSFDPMTLGHRFLVQKALETYDEVVVAVMVNREKEYLFDMDARVKIAGATVSDLNRVRLVSDTGLLVDLYARLGADAVCKGYRNETDLAYEQTMADWNAAHCSRFVTDLIPAPEEYRSLSSTEVRRMLASGQTDALGEMIHPAALPILLREYQKQKLEEK